jgi:hypothetical protein
MDEEASQGVTGHHRIPARPSGVGHEFVDGGLDCIAALGADGGVALLGRAEATGDKIVGRPIDVAAEVA